MQKNKLTIYTLMLGCSLMLLACQSGNGINNTGDISGTYHRTDSSEFSILYQQLQIGPLSSTSDNQYQIKVFSVTDYLDHRTSDTTQKSSNATWDKKSGLLTTDQQLVYHYDPATGKIIVRGSKEVTYDKQ